VVVVPVDEDDLRVGMAKPLGSADTCKASAQNDDAPASLPAVSSPVRHLVGPA
jgi:hypothetical protein